jgi:hypothetical protein
MKMPIIAVNEAILRNEKGDPAAPFPATPTTAPYQRKRADAP